jgi:phage terminase large subunit GpA-like protein
VGINHQFLLGDQREFYVPCPHPDCGCYQTLKFERLRWPVAEGTLRVHADPAVAEKQCWYECEVCERRIDHAEKHAMLALGVWARKGEKVLKDGRLSGEPERPDWGHASFRLNSLYSPFPQMTWGRLARQFLEYQGHPPMAWINGELGEPVREQGESVDARSLIDKAAREAPDYHLGAAPPGVQALILTIDVQADHVYYLVTGWRSDARGFDQWPAIIDADRVECPEIPRPEGLADARADELVMNNWARVEQLLSAAFPVLEARDGRGNQVMKRAAVVGIDSGYRTEEVMRFCRRHGVYAMFGRGRRQVHSAHEEKMVDRLNDGRPLAGGVRQIIHNTDMFKDWAYRSLVQEAPVPGYIRLPSNLRTRPWIAEQLTAEQRVEEAGSRGMSRVWKPKKIGGANHLWDCLVMAFALADRHLLPYLKANQVPAPGAPGAPGAGNAPGAGSSSTSRRQVRITI